MIREGTGGNGVGEDHGKVLYTIPIPGVDFVERKMCHGIGEGCPIAIVARTRQEMHETKK